MTASASRRAKRKPKSAITREHIAASWIYAREYATQGLGVIEWWAKQPDGRFGAVRRFLRELDEAEREQ